MTIAARTASSGGVFVRRDRHSKRYASDGYRKNACELRRNAPALRPIVRCVAANRPLPPWIDVVERKDGCFGTIIVLGQLRTEHMSVKVRELCDRLSGAPPHLGRCIGGKAECSSVQELATCRLKTRAGDQMQIDCGEKWVSIGGRLVRVSLLVGRPTREVHQRAAQMAASDDPMIPPITRRNCSISRSMLVAAGWPQPSVRMAANEYCAPENCWSL